MDLKIKTDFVAQFAKASYNQVVEHDLNPRPG